MRAGMMIGTPGGGVDDSTSKGRRVAILGGGLGSLTTAYELSSRGYDITVYQLGWRLGGQGASGRNQANGRIEEHGLHIWFGFYYNAFKMMRAIYDELNEGPFTRVEDAFVGADDHLFLEHFGDDVRRWLVQFPPDHDFPGTGDSPLPTPGDILERLVFRLKDHFGTHLDPHVPPMTTVPSAATHPLLAMLLAKIRTGVVHPEQAAVGPGVSDALKVATALAPQADSDPAAAAALGGLLHEIGAHVQTWLSEVAHDQLRRAFILFDLGVTIAKGMVNDHVFTEGFASLDQYDFREWLTRHGASPQASSSAVVQGFYDASFAYEDGRSDRPNVAAGVALRCALRIVFCYKGHVLYKMNAGMGDTIFAPLYKVLRKRGVKFEFFHRVTSLEPGPLSAGPASPRGIARIHLARQVDLKQGPYDPLITVKELACWPSTPLTDQIVNGDQLADVDLESYWNGWQNVAPVILEAGTDYDLVVLGISIGALPPICQLLLAEGEPAQQQWADMFAKVKTVRTQGVQLWCRRDVAQTGWGAPNGIIACASEPEASWADFSQVLGREVWPAAAGVNGLFYGCGPVADTKPAIPPPDQKGFPAEQLQQAKALSDRFLAHSASPLWPDATGASGLDAAVIVSRYDRVNIDPSERYVLTVKGSPSAKLRPDGSGFANLFLTGCWVANGVNLSSVEGTVMAGMAAAAAITGEPITIVGDEDWQ